jgi:hypothetical protein
MGRGPMTSFRIAAAWLGVLALVIGSIGVDAHIAEEAHVVCEHGAEVHVERIGDSIAPPSEGGGPTIAAPTWWEVGGDEHCSSTASIVCRASATFAIQSAVVATASRELIPVERAAVARAVYRLAPKTSPPLDRS